MNTREGEGTQEGFWSILNEALIRGEKEWAQEKEREGAKDKVVLITS